MKIFSVIITVFIIFLTSCNSLNRNKAESPEKETKIDSLDTKYENIYFYLEGRKIDNYIITNLPKDLDSILFIPKSERCALFKYPDSVEIEELKEEIGDEAYKDLENINRRYFDKARFFLKNEKIDVYDSNPYRYVCFAMDSSEKLYIDLNSKYSHPWLLLFLSPEKGARTVDFVSIEEEYNNSYK